MLNEPLKIEELLKRLGDAHVPDDVTHRYELRRGLLCSRYFNARHDHWNRVLSFTAPLFAGGVLVFVFFTVGSSLMDVSSPSSIALTSVEQDPSSSESESENQFIDTRTFVPLYDAVKFIPVQNAEYILMH